MTSLKPSNRSSLRRFSLLPATCLAAPLALTLLAACDNGCEQTRENYPHLTLVSTSGRQLVSAAIDMQGIVTTEAGAKDTTMTIQGRLLGKFDNIEVDIDPKANETRLLIRCTYSDYGDRFDVNDTVSIFYDVEPRFIDLSCGCTVTYEITDVTTTHHLFKNIKINNRHVVTDSGTNLTIEY